MSQGFGRAYRAASAVQHGYEQRRIGVESLERGDERCGRRAVDGVALRGSIDAHEQDAAVGARRGDGGARHEE